MKKDHLLAFRKTAFREDPCMREKQVSEKDNAANKFGSFFSILQEMFGEITVAV